MEKIEVGVIAAAGKGTRAYPRSTYIPKPLFEFQGKTILERNVELMQSTFHVKKIYVLVGHLQEMVVSEIERIRKNHRNVEIIPSLWTTKGLASDIASLEPQIRSPFITILGDEFYFHPDHKKFIQTFRKHPKLIASIGVQKTTLLSRIRKNYSVELKGDRILELVEKPSDPPNDLLGLGSYLFTPAYFEYFKKTPPSPKSGVIEITDVIDLMAKESGKVFATELDVEYFNINSMQDYHHAVYEIRNEEFARFKTTLIVPTKNNERSVADVIVDFRGKVDEILVVDFGSTDKTLEIAKKEKAKVLSFETAEDGDHFGKQIREGIRAASGDIAIIVTPDGSYRSKDYPKLLEYLKDSDMVIGTRTTRQMIEQGSNLLPGVRVVNLILGKLIEVFWWGMEPRFTDAMCSYFAIWKDSYSKIEPDLEMNDRRIIPELMMETVRSYMRCIEIPISYYRPIESVPKNTAREFISIVRLMLKKKWFGN
ncbi:glycosyltransferase family 2 protein [Leptospira alstonii]|uniref:Glycosyltransferase, group 2 family protein n=2 Tax=Leptospira alstonii TaxID=28452 RepID=M6CFU4_9LEPT|nr:sugar phosphate nucleotidyltransferase [Leptospira alstonii]EMJ90762.1 glycosyltransferase, group 2 family protein [Leptospira alstonii serovar Sichuan str. 79601]EQA78565.1 glycosyltransferase, group 2 family protein [Leptospira alstonii serovar Pingchang str. 80-412]